MTVQLKVYEPALGQFSIIDVEMDVRFRSMIDSSEDFPTLDTAIGDAIMVRDTKHLYVYVNDMWVDQGVYDIQDLLSNSLMQVLS